MNLSRCFVPRQLLFLLAAGLAIAGACQARGQDTVVLRNGQTMHVKVLGANSTGVSMQTPRGMLTYPFAQVASVTMEAPPEFTAAQTAYENGNLTRASELASAVAKTFRGLPTEWAREAMLITADILVAQNQPAKAAQVYGDYQRAYPGAGTADIVVGLARIEFAKKNFEGAKSAIRPILEQALKQRNPPTRAAGALYGRAFYLAGQIHEAAGDFEGALEDYLRTVTIFPQDRLAAVGAQEHADALRKDHGTAVP